LFEGVVEKGSGIWGVVALEAVVEDVGEDELDVVWMNSRLAVEVGVCLGRALEREEGPDADGVILSDEGSGRLAEGQKVALKSVGKGENFYFLLALGEIVETDEDGALARLGLRAGLELEDVELGFFAREAHGNGEEKAIELRLGEGEGSSGGGVVLSGHDEKGIGQVLRFAIDGDLPLIHGLEEGGLRARRGPIDLIGEKEIGKHWAGYEVEAAVALMIEIVAEDVGREEVGSELEALETATHRSGEGMGQRGFSNARRPGEEGMPTGQEGSEEKIGRVIRAKDGGEEMIANGGKRGMGHSLL
jgi:hypothetical protein